MWPALWAANRHAEDSRTMMTAFRSQDVPPEAESICDEILAPLRSTFSRLVALASLRQSSGEYRSPKLDAAFPPEVVTQALSSRHERTFREWLRLGLEYQHTQLSEFFASFPEQDLAAVLESPSTLIPASASSAERTLFLDDFRLVLSLIDRG